MCECVNIWMCGYAGMKIGRFENLKMNESFSSLRIKFVIRN
jgi:hypothetical protein